MTTALPNSPDITTSNLPTPPSASGDLVVDIGALTTYVAQLTEIQHKLEEARQYFLGIVIEPGNFSDAQQLKARVDSSAGGGNSVSDAAYQAIQKLEETMRDVADALAKAIETLDAAEQANIDAAGAGTGGSGATNAGAVIVH
jgi:hypothetical protein